GDRDAEVRVRMRRQLAPPDRAHARARLLVAEADEAGHLVLERHGRSLLVVGRSQVRHGTNPSAYSTPHCSPRNRETARICSTTSTPSWSRSHVSWLSCAS